MPQESFPGFGGGAPRLTSSSGWGTGSGCSSMLWNIEKIAVVDPIPSAREMMAITVTAGAFANVRNANLSFFTMTPRPAERMIVRRTATIVPGWRLFFLRGCLFSGGLQWIAIRGDLKTI